MVDVEDVFVLVSDDDVVDEDDDDDDDVSDVEPELTDDEEEIYIDGSGSLVNVPCMVGELSSLEFSSVAFVDGKRSYNME